jgi:hypothetical protein
MLETNNEVHWEDMLKIFDSNSFFGNGDGRVNWEEFWAVIQWREKDIGNG